MEVKSVKIVVVNHPNCGTSYIFKVPEHVRLECGERVLCRTRKNPCEIGVCITPSFEIIEPHLIEYYHVSVSSLKPVVGRLEPHMFLLDPEDKE